MQTLNLRQSKSRLVLYWVTDLYRYLGQFLPEKNIYIENNWDEYTIGSFLIDQEGDNTTKKNLIGDIDFLEALLAFQLGDNDVSISMPYSDSIRYYATVVIYNSSKMKKKDKIVIITKIIEK